MQANKPGSQVITLCNPLEPSPPPYVEDGAAQVREGRQFLIFGNSMQMKSAQETLAYIGRYHDELTSLRRDLHMHPELGFEETYTAGRVKGALKETLFAGDVAESLVGAANVRRAMEPSTGSEDFAFMLQVKPGCYLRIGQGTNANLHNSHYDFNDAILPLGASLHARLVEAAMPLTKRL